MGEINPNRDIRNHYLFEIATEVANRGSYAPGWNLGYVLIQLQLVVSTPCSSRKLPSPPPNMATDIA